MILQVCKYVQYMHIHMYMVIYIYIHICALYIHIRIHEHIGDSRHHKLHRGAMGLPGLLMECNAINKYVYIYIHTYTCCVSMRTMDPEPRLSRILGPTTWIQDAAC